MDQRDLDTFTANYQWFSEFFDGIRQFFSLVIQSLPDDFLLDDFAETSGNYFYPRLNYGPTMPSHYALMLRGRDAALQVIAVLDTRVYGGLSRLRREPSIVAVLHGQADRYGYVQDYGLRVIGGAIDVDDDHDQGFLVGTIDSVPPTLFAARQISFGKLSTPEDVRDAIETDIVGLVTHGIRAQKRRPRG